MFDLLTEIAAFADRLCWLVYANSQHVKLNERSNYTKLELTTNNKLTFKQESLVITWRGEKLNVWQIQKASDERKKNKKNKSEMAKTNDELRKISKRLNQDSINKFKKERNGIKIWQM